ncbi:uncharacterized protein LOC117110079 [Anneissia japonica]|uniref:uncharacterized protein LOC117110079 n=1 Tax=Anneissia japonica TaxID=1529436 RepID=UPI00142576E8|nr:uncharacterized protein LOC117110079 [Anneissia japonica]XP_033108554.1 uncharacterized protein LOC117110079 [Anneissia japonica]XP_033108555.1 uncharacterized protein LOC117110079 [Anneissia japonica]
MSADSTAGCRTCRITKAKMLRCAQCRNAYYCSRPCQIKDWPAHKIICKVDSETLTSKDMVDVKNDLSTYEKSHDKDAQHVEEKQSKDEICDEQITITVKCNKDKIKVSVSNQWTGSEVLSNISDAIKVREMKLIHKGRIMNESNIKEFLKEKALFQAIGEQSESEDGLNSMDIDCIVAQAKVDRNKAIRALRRTGDVVDAILYISNQD